MQDKMRIAFYTDTFLPAVDGVVTSILNAKRELEKNGHTVYVFASGDGSSRSAARNYKNVFVARGIKLKKYPQYNIAFLPSLDLLRLYRSIDIVHAHTPFTMGMSALVFAKLNKVPLVASFHTLFTNKSVIKEYTVENKKLQKLILKHAWNYARFFYNKCNAVIAPSNAIKKILLRHGIKNVFVVPNGINLERFDYKKISGAKARRKLLGGRKGKLVLYLGRISKEKNIEVMLEAAKILRSKRHDIYFAIGGAGPAEEHYKRLAEELGIGDAVKFLGFIKDKKLPEYYAACDLLCMPSTFETQGIVALEAMAMNKPVVAANYLALKEIVVNGKNGEKFVPGSARSCAGKIERVINSKGKYNAMRETAERYSEKEVTRKLLNIYKDISSNNTQSYL
ncbi:MAG: glycosyltransferase [Candidatus Micrarchaeia archaeon]